MTDTWPQWLQVALRWSWVPALIAIAAGGWFTHEMWLPQIHDWIEQAKHAKDPEKKKDSGHEGHDHDHGHAHDAGNSIELSDQARKNVDLETTKVAIGPFERAITVPGIIIEKPGRSTVNLTTPVTGVITKIYATQGQAVQPGERLFDLRLTHEEIVQAQVDYLRVAEEIDVIKREIARIETVVRDGAVPGKTLIERNYELQLKEAAFRAGRQSLLLHGLSAEEVDGIQKSRKLLSEIVVRAPGAGEEMASSTFQVRKLNVERGMYVDAGKTLAELTDHAELYIEGNAFEQDNPELQRVSQSGINVSATIEARGGKFETIDKLHILYISGEVDAVNRTSHFYVPLKNQLLTPPMMGETARFITWKYRPGQRVQIQVPVEMWKDRIVLPIDSVADDGVESYVFVQNGKKFDRRPVHVEFRDPARAVIANDGALFPGDVVAIRGAHQLHLAMKNKAGGGPDPHAGHNH